jgi:hypothetical protein
MIRKALSPEYYKPHSHDPDDEGELLGFSHLDHCVDSIRQSLMCHSDITPMVWQWDDEKKKHFPRLHLPHTCRDFGAIQKWAREHETPADSFDLYFREMNDPLDPETWLTRH